MLQELWQSGIYERIDPTTNGTNREPRHRPSQMTVDIDFSAIYDREDRLSNSWYWNIWTFIKIKKNYYP